jgi:hypothetical protein
MSGAFEPPRAETRAATWLPKPTGKHKNLRRARWFIELLHGNARSARDPGNGTRNGRGAGVAADKGDGQAKYKKWTYNTYKVVGWPNRCGG